MTSEQHDKNGNPTMRLLTILYIAIGIVQVGYFAIEYISAPPHILVLGLLSLITAYMLYTLKKWALPLVVGLFFVGMVFGATTLFHSIMLQTDALLFHIALVVYMIILLIATVYIISRKNIFN